MDVNALTAAAIATLIAVAWKVAGALVLWLVGRWLIHFALRLLGRALAPTRFDPTLTRYMQTGLSGLLNVVAGRRHPRLLRRRDDDVSRRCSRPAASPSVSPGAACWPTSPPARSWSSCGRSRSATSSPPEASRARSTRLACSARRSTRPTTSDDRRQQQDLLGHDPELLGEPVPPRGPDRDDQRRRRSSRRDHLLKTRLDALRTCCHAGPGVDVLQFTPAGPVLCVRPYCNNDHYWQVTSTRTGRGVRRSGLPGAHARVHGHRRAGGADRNRGPLISREFRTVRQSTRSTRSTQSHSTRRRGAVIPNCLCGLCVLCVLRCRRGDW